MSSIDSLHPLSSHQRQVHLDFHTSPWIPDVAADFDAKEFAEILQKAHVNSVTIFAKCHHGYTYFPSKVCDPHPQLTPCGRDLLGEQIEALHRAGIRCPIYITVGWDALLTRRHPEWRAMFKNGLFGDWNTGHPGQWNFVNWIHPDVIAHIEALTREILDRYKEDVDGFFYDIVFFAKGACWSPESCKFREKFNLWDDSPAGFEKFQVTAQMFFAEHFTRIIHSIRPQATVFYNTPNDSFFLKGYGSRPRLEFMTHMEIESLPSGFWGYWHFPRLARSCSHWGKPWLGMTGRFQTLWGDFGGIKPQPALEYECFRAQAMGGANSIGDQLPPRGKLDPAAYHLIGEVYAQIEAAEPFYKGSVPIPQVGITTSGRPGLDADETAKSDEGAIQMCEEAHYDCALLDETDDLSPYDLIILGDTTTPTPYFIEKLREYYEQGGKLLISYKGGCDADGNWILDFLPIRVVGELKEFPAYWRTRPEFSADLARGDRVFYQQGLKVEAEGCEILVERVLPYFKRDAVRYCSHLQTPPRPDSSGQPVVVKGDRFIYFSDPIFREYRQSGNICARDAWRRAMELLIGPPPFGAGLASTIQLYPRRRGEDLILTLLHYIPIRKCLNIDMIEERTSFGGQRLRLPEKAEFVRIYQGEELERAADGSFLLPANAAGRLLLEVPGFFS